MAINWNGNNQRNETTQDVEDKKNYFNGMKLDPNFDKRKQFRYFECGDKTPFRPV